MKAHRFAFLPVLAACAMTVSAPAVRAAVAPADAPSPLDGKQVEAARPVVEKLFPVGTYRRMMGQNISKMMSGMMDGFLKMPIADIARIGGVSEDQIADIDDASLQEVAAILDPHFRERTKGGMDAMMAEMTDMMYGFEPRVRDALSRAYARKFSATELQQLRSFFETPTGSKYASQSMSIFMEPEIMGEMQALMPEMMEQMPKMAEAAKKAADALPPPRKIADLSDAERKRLAKLLGVRESDLRDRPEAALSDEDKEGTEQ